MTRRNFHVDDPSIPLRSGVYIVHDGRNVLDVGQSSKVGQRLAGHERRSCWSDHARGPVQVQVVWTPGKQSAGRRAVEREIRERLDPDCGDR